MAIKLEFINVIILIASIREKLGEKVFDESFSIMTDCVWHDEYLYRDGCMNGADLKDLLTQWEERGFKLFEIIDGKKHWLDVCVVNSGFGPSFPCRWLEYDKSQNIVWLKDHDSGPAVGR